MEAGAGLNAPSDMLGSPLHAAARFDRVGAARELIAKGADPDVQTDIISGLSEIVPQLNFKHVEGNSSAHIMTLLTGSSLTIQIENKRLQLGTWQRIFFCEFDGPRSRSLNWRIDGA